MGFLPILFFSWVSALFSWDRVAVCSLGWPGAPYKDQAGLELEHLEMACLCFQNDGVTSGFCSPSSSPFNRHC